MRIEEPRTPSVISRLFPLTATVLTIVIDIQVGKLCSRALGWHRLPIVGLREVRGRRRPRSQSVWLHDLDGQRRVKPGFAFGKTDEYGYYAIENKLEIHDLHATMLYLLGLDHKKLTFRFSSRDMRLTDVHGQVVHEIIA
jgi:Protein of unknown function (DUF1501)